MIVNYPIVFSLQDMAKVSAHFVRGGDPKKFASALVNFMGKVILITIKLLFFFKVMIWTKSIVTPCSATPVKMTSPLPAQFYCKYL